MHTRTHKVSIHVSFHRENPLIHLNYAIILYSHGEQRSAAKQFQLFKRKSQKQKPAANPDPEVWQTVLEYSRDYATIVTVCLIWIVL